MAAVAVNNGGGAAIALFEPQHDDPELNSMFRQISEALNAQYMTWDEVGNICKQITWESKRAVSQVIGYFQNRKSLKNCRINLRNIVKNERYLPLLAKKLKTLDKFYYARCYSPPIQEFIEAFALWVFFKKGRLVTYEEVQRQLTVTLVLDRDCSGIQFADHRYFDPDMRHQTYAIPVSRADYFLGIADIAGELVRACAAGFHSASFKHFLFSSCELVRSLHRGLQLLQFSRNSKAMQQKLYVIRSSLMKLECACYNAALDFDRYLSFGNISVKELEYYEDVEDEPADAQ